MIFISKNKKPIATGVIVKTNAFQQIGNRGTVKYNMFDAAKAKKCGSCPALNQ